jgi:ATP-dependent Clp protease adaptor protein ClpS
MANNENPQQNQQGAAVLEATRAEVVPPGRFQVILLNDDFTPMDFVV